MDILKLENVSYSYDNSENIVLDNINYSFEKGKLYGIVGKSGTGKTTLLSLLSGLTSPTTGTIIYNDESIEKIDKYKYRSNYVGIIFQSFNLLTQLTAKENVILSMDVSGKKIENKEELASKLLSKVKLSEEKQNRRILKLSGGEQQRVAIARALSFEPDIILADEPTGNLDLDTQAEILNIFKDLAYKDNKCVIIVTHSPDVASSVDELYRLSELKSNEVSADQQAIEASIDNNIDKH